MLFSFKKKQPQELCKKLLKQLSLFNSETDPNEKAKIQEKILSIFIIFRTMIYGDDENDPKMNNIKKLRDEFVNNQTKLFIILLRTAPSLNASLQNEFPKIANFFLHRARQNHFVDYILENKEIIDLFMEGLENEKSFTHFSSMVSECIKHKDLATLFLDPTRLDRFFALACNPRTDISMEAFKILRLLITEHSRINSPYLMENFDMVFKHHFENLLNSKNYFTVTKTLNLLYDILTEPKNKPVLKCYVNQIGFLVHIMELLRSKKLNLQIAAYNIFKLFLGSAHKPPDINRVLYNNRAILLDFLERYLNEEDINIEEDKKLLVQRLSQLKDSSETVQN